MPAPAWCLRHCAWVIENTHVHCLVTAGPTIEPIDAVRRLTNLSTGRLGCRLADALARAGHRVTLLLSDTAQHQPRHRAIKIIHFNTTEDLREKIRDASLSNVAAVFHAAAVSDFRVPKKRQTDGKIPTSNGKLTLELETTPKLIRSLRRWFPKAKITGWKYEVDGNRGTALANAAQQIRQNRTDACVINGPAYGEGFGLATSLDCIHLNNLPALNRKLISRIKNGPA